MRGKGILKWVDESHRPVTHEIAGSSPVVPASTHKLLR